MPYTGKKQGLKIPEACSLADRNGTEKNNMLPLPHGPVEIVCCGYAASVHSKRLVNKAITCCAYLPITFSDFGTSLSSPTTNQY